MAMAAGENGTMVAAMPGASAGGIALGAGASGLAGQGAAEAGAGPLGQMAAQAVVGMGIPLVTPLASEMIKSAFLGAASRRAAAQQSGALLRAGDPNAGASLGQISQQPAVRVVQAGLGKIPFANATLTKALDAQATNMQGQANGVADAFSPRGNVISAGRNIQRGIEEGFIPQFKATGGQLYNKVFSVVPPTTIVQPSATAALFAQQENLLARARPFADDFLIAPQMQGWGKQLTEALQQNPNGIEFGTLKAFRTLIGDAMSGSAEMVGPRIGELRKLYGALSKDMETASCSRVPRPSRTGTERICSGKPGWTGSRTSCSRSWIKKVPDQAFRRGDEREPGRRLHPAVHHAEPRPTRAQHRPERRGAPDGCSQPRGPGCGRRRLQPGDVPDPVEQLSPVARGALFDGADPLTVGNLNNLAKAVEIRKNAA
jgi:hypothetical protein